MPKTFCLICKSTTESCVTHTWSVNERNSVGVALLRRRRVCQSCKTPYMTLEQFENDVLANPIGKVGDFKMGTSISSEDKESQFDGRPIIKNNP